MTSDSDPNHFDSDDRQTLPPAPLDDQTIAPSGTKPESSVQPSVTPALDGYEILDELGRGGMGVVYRARDTKLDRIVALKMILGGKFASADEIQRFQIEAEAAARLDHPGIVPIYETSESGGNHFFSMKFIDGTSLADRLEDFRSNERATAELMIKNSRAVQHAHQRGVLHRDLKPANVLLDSDDEPSITDLGLAKRMDDTSELTQTGIVMGTPGFMAPEQAAGRKDVTTAADVFSLGAILYWLVAGEAPFKGETAVQTVMNTIEAETPSLRSVVTGANSDLDLICQKALSKEPLDRYSSAAEFADDLQAWLDGELLSVRAPTAIGMASVWVRKNLRTVLAACFTGAITGLIIGLIIAFEELIWAAELQHRANNLQGKTTTWLQNFVGVRSIPQGWQAIQFLIVPTVAVLGFLCVLFVRPKTKEANIIAGVTTGLAAGIVAFLAGAGWQSVKGVSLDVGTNDIELLSKAAWMESDVERKLAQRAMIQRYPGLAEIDIDKRPKRMRQKIELDQVAGVMPGIWLGICVVVLYVVLPLASTVILSGMLWQQGIRGWQWFGATWERCAYSLIFFLIISFWLRTPHPSNLLMVGSLLALSVALFLAVKSVRWPWRVAMIPVPFVAMFLINYDVGMMRYSGNILNKSTNDLEVKSSLDQSDRLLRQAEIDFQRYFTGIGRLYLGDEEAYQFHCQELLDNFENAYRPEIASRLAKICMLRPDLQKEENLEKLYELSEFASAFESSDLCRWFYLTRALSELRQGKPGEAIKWNLRCRGNNFGDGYMIAGSHLVDAIANIKLDDRASAVKNLEIGQKLNKKTREQSMEDGHDPGRVDHFVFQILEKEVQQLLEETN